MITVRLSREEREKFKEAAARMGMSLNQWCLRGLYDEVARQEAHFGQENNNLIARLREASHMAKISFEELRRLFISEVSHVES